MKVARSQSNRSRVAVVTVAPCISDAPANGSISGFSSGRVTTVRSGSGDALEFVAPIEADVSGCDQTPLVTVCVCMHGAGANDDTSLSFIIQSIYTIYIRAPRRVVDQQSNQTF